ncbi:MAG TPA: acyl-CoA dehydrogenase family protein [Dehalococcoidia bacterium]|jgi:alkylation response protein AidB-like acyl-CoA dehydrogenase|nr:acyl-CoA dehydrogenase family protein [Dehalococcoidia bacterium]
MDWKFTPEEEAFRAEMQAFLAEALPADWKDSSFKLPADATERDDLAASVTRKLAEKDWLAMAWPKESGGLDASHMQQMIYNEEAAYNAMPGGGGMGVAWVGPAIMLYGTDEQKEYFLPRITNADDIWCTLYSEPTAGSDLAALQTRAIRDGDEYVLNGQKIWTSGGHTANMGWLAARTDPAAPKHRGISTFVIPMDAPGITVRPLVNLANEHSFNEVFFEDVRIPAENLVGQENRGWYQVATALDFERSGVGAYAGGKRNVERLVELAKRDPSLIVDRQQVRYELADRWLEIEVGFNIAYRIPWMQSQGMVPNAEASISKLYGSELSQRIAGTGIKMLGLAGNLTSDTDGTALGGGIARSYLGSVSSTIAAGTSEVQRNIIAQRGLGLPRG